MSGNVFWDLATAGAEARLRSQSDPPLYWFVVEELGEFRVERSLSCPSPGHPEIKAVYQFGLAVPYSVRTDG